MPNVFILNDTSDHSNWGSLANIEALKTILTEALPGVTYTSLDSRWVGRIYRWDPWVFGRRAFNRTSFLADRITSRYHLLPEVVDEYEYVAEQWMAGKGGSGARDFLDRVGDADAVVFNAEGSTYRNNHSALKCLFMLWLAKTRFNKPAFFLNGNVTLTEVDPILPAMVRKVFRVLDGITVRVPNALRMVQQAVPDARAELVPDAVFLFDESECSPAGPGLEAFRARVGDRPYFCFSLSMLPMDFRRTRDQSSLHHVIHRLKQLVPQAVLMAKDPEDQFLRAVAEDTGSLFFGQDQSFRDVMTILRDARFLFSGRYHHLIMASNVGCPSVPLISTSPKVQGLSELMGDVMPTPFDPTDLWGAVESIEREARHAMDGGKALRVRVKERSGELRTRVRRMGEMVRERLVREPAGGPSVVTPAGTSGVR